MVKLVVGKRKKQRNKEIQISDEHQRITVVPSRYLLSITELHRDWPTCSEISCNNMPWSYESESLRLSFVSAVFGFFTIEPSENLLLIFIDFVFWSCWPSIFSFVSVINIQQRKDDCNKNRPMTSIPLPAPATVASVWWWNPALSLTRLICKAAITQTHA